MADEVLNALQQAGQEALAYADAHEAAFTQGGRLAHEEIEKSEAAAAQAPPDDPAKTEGSTPLETQPEAPSTDDPWALLAAGTGKWKDAEEAKKGYFHAMKLAKDALAERDLLQQQLTSNGRHVTPERGQEPVEQVDPLKAIEEFGVPAEALARAIDQRAEQRLMAILTPMAQQMEAENYMVSKYGDGWTKNKPEVELYVQSDPEVRARVDGARAKGEFALANEYAMLRYGQAKGSQVEEALKANNQVRNEIVKEQRKDAAIVGSKRSEGRDADTKPEGLTPERFEDLKARARAGYEMPLWRETIGKTFPPGLFE